MLLTILIFFILLSVLVLIHEIGHFVAAKKFGIRVDEFGFGLPPRIIGKKIGETIYSINWLPIGGFVKLYGEEGEEQPPLDPLLRKEGRGEVSRAFYARPPWQRAVVLTAGVAMNFVLAVIVLSYLFTRGVMLPVPRVHIVAVEKGSVAETAGIKPGDVVIAVNDEPIEKAEIFSDTVRKHLGEPVNLTILRGAPLVHHGDGITPCSDCETLTIAVVPRPNPPLKTIPQREPSFVSKVLNQIRSMLGVPLPKEEPEREGPIGVVISSMETRIYPWYKAPFLGLREAFRLSWMLVSSLGDIVIRLITRQAVSLDVAGPIGIAQVTDSARRYGPEAVLELLGLLSLNLAIINILPFPALDGGRLLFVAIEGLFRRKVHTHYERALHQAGMIFLLFLILMVTINDIARILRVGQ